MFDVFSNEKFIKDIVTENRTLAQKIKDFLTDLISELREMITHFHASAEMNALRTQTKALEDINSSFISALETATKNMHETLSDKTKNTATKSGVRYSFQGYAKDGKGKYKGNFPKGTPKFAKSKKILEYIQNVWSKEPIKLKIFDGSESKYIYAKFDPYYDESGNTLTDASKLMGGNRHGTSAEQRVTLDLAEDYYQIASESVYNYSKDEIGKSNPAHKDVTKWHYFVNDIYFAEYESDEYVPYRVSINIKERADGDFVYSFSAEKEKKLNTQRTLHAVVNDVKNTANGQLSNNNISQDVPVVNNNSMQKNSDDTKNRRSIKLTQKSQQALDEHPELKNVLQSLQNELRLTKGYVPEGKVIHKYAAQLKKDNPCGMSVAEIESDLREIYSVLSSMSGSEGYEYAADLTLNLAKKMLDDSKVLNKADAEKKELRQRLTNALKGHKWYLSPQMRAEIEYHYGVAGILVDGTKLRNIPLNVNCFCHYKSRTKSRTKNQTTANFYEQMRQKIWKRKTNKFSIFCI